MYKILRATKDTYVTNRKIAGKDRSTANLGRANTLDLFKIAKEGGSHELSRLLVHFDVSSIKEMVTAGKLNPFDDTFQCILRLKDVYGGQTTPQNFKICVNPLSRSFVEGQGRDIVQYSDGGVANFLSSSVEDSAWELPGAAKGANFGENCDFFTNFGDENLTSEQSFASGEEDLEVDVTAAVRLVVSSQLPDAGFRVALSTEQESDNFSYFVKRFGARTAYDSNYWPELVVKFDDSYHDETQLFEFDTECRIFFHNYSMGQPQNVASGSTFLTGEDCMMLKLLTEVSGGYYEMLYDASQLYVGDVPITGVYVSSVVVPSVDTVVAGKMELSGSVKFWPIWSSQDETINFYPDKKLTIEPKQGLSTNPANTTYTVTTTGLKSDVHMDEAIHVRVNFFDPYSKFSKLVKKPLITPGIVVRDAFWSIRNVDTNRVVIPFDGERHSTRLSSDSEGLWFVLDGSNLIPEQRYVIDVMTSTGGTHKLYRDVSPVFRVRSR